MGLFSNIAGGIKGLGRALDPMAQLFPEWGDFAHETVTEFSDKVGSEIMKPFDEVDRFFNPFRNEDSPLYSKEISEFHDEVAEQPVTAAAIALGTFFTGGALAGAGGAGAGGAAAGGSSAAGFSGSMAGAISGAQAAAGTATTAGTGMMSAASTGTMGSAIAGAQTAGAGAGSMGLLDYASTAYDYANQGMEMYQQVQPLLNPQQQQIQMQQSSARKYSGGGYGGGSGMYTIRGGLLQ